MANNVLKSLYENEKELLPDLLSHLSRAGFFSEEYKTIAQSSKYFMFLDADEFPFFMDLENGVLKVDNFKNSLRL